MRFARNNSERTAAHSILGDSKMFRLRESLILIATCAAMTAFTLQAAQAALLTTSGTWGGVTPLNVNNLNGVGTSTLSWGTPLTAGGQSSYDYTGVNSLFINLPTNIGDMTTFTMGTFTHDNQVISGAVANPTITGTTLTISFDLLNGTLASGTLTFDFLHNETVNFPAGGVCVFGGV